MKLAQCLACSKHLIYASPACSCKFHINTVTQQDSFWKMYKTTQQTLPFEIDLKDLSFYLIQCGRCFNNHKTYCDLLEFPYLALALWSSEGGRAKGLTRLKSEFFMAVWFYFPTRPETN